MIPSMTCTAQTLSSPTPAVAGWRRAAVVVLVVCLAVLQGLAPLLHVHLAPGGGSIVGDAQRGVHLPVSLAHAGHPAQGLGIDCAGMDDSAVITTPSELKRDDALAVCAPLAPPPALQVASVASGPGDALPRTAVPDVGVAHLRPPAHAPPAIA